MLRIHSAKATLPSISDDLSNNTEEVEDDETEDDTAVAWDWRDAAGDRSAGIETWANRHQDPEVARRLQGINAASGAIIIAALATRLVALPWAPLLVQSASVAAWIARGKVVRDRRAWSHMVVAIDALCAFCFGVFVRVLVV